jgi:hypothetical protein
MKRSVKGLALFVMALALVFGVVACNDSSNGKSDDKKTEAKKENNTDKKKQLAGELSNFAFDVQTAISQAYAPYAVLDGYAGAEGDAYVAQDVKDAFAQTKDSASALDNVTVPDSLSDYKTDLEAALKDLKDSFAKRAEAAAANANVKDGKALADAVTKISSAAQPSFDSFQTKFNDVAKKLGLEPMDFTKALSN